MDATSQVSDSQHLDLQAINAALNRVQALIEFELDGTILHANDNFLRTLGYTLAEVQGKHHSMFCDPEYVNTPAYQQFWSRLAGGEFNRGDTTSVSPRMARKSGSTLPTTRSSTPTANRTR